MYIFFSFVGTIVFDQGERQKTVVREVIGEKSPNGLCSHERERERERAIVRMKERKSVQSCSVCVLSNHVSHMLFKILTTITHNIVTQKLKIALDVFPKYSV